MKQIRVEIEDDIHDRLMKFCSHHGMKSFIIRNGIKLIVQELEKKEHKNAD